MLINIELEMWPDFGKPTKLSHFSFIFEIFKQLYVAILCLIVTM